MWRISGKRFFRKMFQQPTRSGPTGAGAYGRASNTCVEWPTRGNCSPMSLLSDHDLYLFNEGSHVRLYDRLGSHARTVDGVAGTNFAVWAPDAEVVNVMGAFNDWNNSSHPMRPVASSGIWEVFVPGAKKGESYKYHVVSRYHGYQVDKADPFAIHAENPPKTASIVWDLDYQWHDQK